ncbi:MAG: hypothetical protein ACK5HL_04370 [Bacilli bacterium]
MYTNYEQFKVVRSIMDGYSKEQTQHFAEYSTRLKEFTTNSAFDINNPSIVQTLAGTTSQMNAYQQDYLKAQAVLKKLGQISVSSYETAIPMGSQVDTKAMQEKGDAMFQDVLASQECNGILSEMAYSLYVEQKFPMDIKASYSMESINERESQIQAMLESGSITKEQAIYWSTMQTALSNSEHFIEYANQFEQPKTM